VVIGCDGVHSRIARWLGLGEPVYSGRSGIRGLAVCPQGHGLNGVVHQMVDVSKRGGLVPLNDKEAYWFLSCKTPPKDIGDDPNLLLREVIDNLAKDFPPLYLDIIGHSDLSTVSWVQVMFRYPWDVIRGTLTRANVTVAGDAMHPMTPDLGQGGCLALEDAVVLGRHIGSSISQGGELEMRNVGSALESYVRERRWRAATLMTASFLSGWVQQDGSSWWMKFLRDVVFYKFLLRIAVRASRFDCGKLC
ncbi:FAD_binding_3 domain-containing protein, partial [Psidium guajava]